VAVAGINSSEKNTYFNIWRILSGNMAKLRKRYCRKARRNATGGDKGDDRQTALGGKTCRDPQKGLMSLSELLERVTRIELVTKAWEEMHKAIKI